MAVDLLGFPSPIHEGEMELVDMSSFLGSDVIQSGELDRMLETLLLKISPVRKNSMTRELVLQCPDGGHRCPYFPCPYCHRTRSIFGPETSSICKSENELLHQEISNADTDMNPLIINSDESDDFFVVPALECGDGGHRCPYFPCPYCHRSRSISGPKTSKSENGVLHQTEISNSYTDMDPFIITSGERELFFVECGDGGHKCPYFPCPYCHRSRSIFTGTESTHSDKVTFPISQ
jgi:hypothetical protein